MDEMTTAELNQYLENIAKLIESTAKDPEAAAKIVRDSKVKTLRLLGLDGHFPIRLCLLRLSPVLPMRHKSFQLGLIRVLPGLAAGVEIRYDGPHLTAVFLPPAPEEPRLSEVAGGPRGQGKDRSASRPRHILQAALPAQGQKRHAHAAANGSVEFYTFSPPLVLSPRRCYTDITKER